MAHDAGVGARHVEQHGVVGLGQVVLLEHAESLDLEQVALNQGDVALGAREVLRQPLDARSGQIEGHHPARAHRVGDRQALAAGRGACIQHGFAGLRREQFDRVASGGVLEENHAFVDQRFDAGPAAGFDFVKTGPGRGRKQRRIGLGGGAAGDPPARVDRGGLLIPFQQGAGGGGSELGQPAAHQPFGMRVIRRQLGGAGGLGRLGLGVKGGSDLAHDGVDHLGLGLTGERLGLLDRVVHHPGGVTIVAPLDQLVTGQQQHGLDDRARRAGEQRGKNRLDAAQVAHRAEKQVLATSTFGAAQGARQAVEKGVDALLVFEPAHQQFGRGRPSIHRPAGFKRFSHVAPSSGRAGGLQARSPPAQLHDWVPSSA